MKPGIIPLSPGYFCLPLPSRAGVLVLSNDLDPADQNHPSSQLIHSSTGRAELTQIPQQQKNTDKKINDTFVSRFCMKKALISILSLFYLVATCGVGMNLHYCCDTLAKVDLSLTSDAANPGASCDKQSDFPGNGCCRDVHKDIKITLAQHTVSEIAFVPLPSFTAILPVSPKVPIGYFSAITKERISPHDPPALKNSPAYLKNCSFLI